MMHTTTVRVRYSETDAMGIVHHSNYLRFFEVGRVELMRDAGFPYTEFEAQGITSPVIESALRWRQPARFDDLLTIETQLAEVTPTRIRFAYRILRDGVLLCEGHTGHAFTGPSGRPVALSKAAPDLWERIRLAVPNA
jgi:acyl-CoA thioester hydrolase